MSTRVGLVGPVHPFRGGIAHHDSQLFAALSARTPTRCISFTRLYPPRVFPGAAERDPELPALPGVDYLLDSLDPRSWRRAARLLHEVDLLVFPWWTPVLAPVFGSLAWSLRRRGGRVVVVVHNLEPHEALPGAGLAREAVFRLAHGFVAQTRADADALRARHPRARVRYAPHPLPEAAPPHGTLPRRAPLELLFFGFVRPYKGLDLLYEALALLPDLDLRLSVVGEAWGEEPAVADPRVERVARYVGEADAAAFFARADVVLLPYRSATGSGVVPQALRHGKPVIATAVGGLPDQVDPDRSGLLVPPGDPHAFAAAIRRFATMDPAAMAPAIAARARALDPAAFAEVVLEAAAR